MNSQKVRKTSYPSFRRKPESSHFKELSSLWTPVFTGVTTFYEAIKVDPCQKTKHSLRVVIRSRGEVVSLARMGRLIFYRLLRETSQIFWGKISVLPKICEI